MTPWDSKQVLVGRGPVTWREGVSAQESPMDTFLGGGGGEPPRGREADAVAGPFQGTQGTGPPTWLFRERHRWEVLLGGSVPTPVWPPSGCPVQDVAGAVLAEGEAARGQAAPGG